VYQAQLDAVYYIFHIQRISPMRKWSVSNSSHLSYHKKTTSSVRISCWSRPSQDHLHPSSSHQSTSSGLAPPSRSTTADMAPSNWTRPSTPKAWSKHSTGLL